MARYKGKVIWFSNPKGHGFLGREGGPDVFVHYSAIRSAEEYKSLKVGDEVEFDIVQDGKGIHASNVTRFKDTFKTEGLTFEQKTAIICRRDAVLKESYVLQLILDLLERQERKGLAGNRSSAKS